MKDNLHTVPSWAKSLAEAAHCAPSADNSQPWRFEWDGKHLIFGIDAERLADGLELKHPALNMSMGAAIENLHLAGRAIGLDDDCLKMSDDSCHSWEFLRIEEVNYEGSLQTIASDHPIFLRHTNRCKFLRQPLDDESLSWLMSQVDGEAKIWAYCGQSVIHEIAALVRAASSLRFRNEHIHRWFVRNLRFPEEKQDALEKLNDGLDVRTLCLPVGGKILLRSTLDWRRMAFGNRLGLHRILSRIEANMLHNCGAVVAVLVPDFDKWSALSGGRLMERAWVEMNRRGYAVHPYFVLPDQLYRLRTESLAPDLATAARDLENQTRKFFGSEHTPLILLRIGRKVRDVPRSRRRPIQQVLTYISDEKSYA